MMTSPVFDFKCGILSSPVDQFSSISAEIRYLLLNRQRDF